MDKASEGLYLRKTFRGDGTQFGLKHKCPACEYNHTIPVHQRVEGEAHHVWTYNGNVESPTFHPSVNISATARDGTLIMRCHYFVVNGKINFCDDCTHKMKGMQNVPMIPFTLEDEVY